MITLYVARLSRRLRPSIEYVDQRAVAQFTMLHQRSRIDAAGSYLMKFNHARLRTHQYISDLGSCGWQSCRIHLTTNRKVVEYLASMQPGSYHQLYGPGPIEQPCSMTGILRCPSDQSTSTIAHKQATHHSAICLPLRSLSWLRSIQPCPPLKT